MSDVQEHYISSTTDYNNPTEKEINELQSAIPNTGQTDDNELFVSKLLSAPKEHFDIISSDDVSSSNNSQEQLLDSSSNLLPETTNIDTMARTKNIENHNVTPDKIKSHEDTSETEKSKQTKELHLKSPLGLWIKENLNISIIQLIYWYDVQRSAVTFIGILFLLMSLYFYPVIQVVSVFGLSLLIVAFLYRIGITVINAIQKTSTEHPFKNLLEEKIELSEQSVAYWSTELCFLANKSIGKFQHLFLIKDVVDSIKFGLLLWLLSYIGSFLSLLTITIFGVTLLFTIPKLYEEKQNEIKIIYNLVVENILQVLLRIESKIPEKVKAIFLKNKKD